VAPSSRSNPAWAELLQLVPVVTLASSFLVAGEVDFARAAPLFVVSAALTVPITAVVRARGHVLNPILLGAALWLWLGAAAFGVPIASLASWLGETRAVGLFVGSLAVGVLATLLSPTGYVGGRHPDPAWVRRSSLALLGLTLLAVGWSWTFRTHLRLGAGLPFIGLNVARRLLLARAAALPGPAA
jgi:hypothetical protein